jgi:predicted nuclease of predicted toxin-antitoxin system
MNIKLDENLPASLIGSLVALGHDVDTVPGEGLTGRDDMTVFRAAQGAERFLITQDLDFSDIRTFKPGTHYGILLLRLREPGRNALRERVEAVFQSEDVATWLRAFVVITDSKVRVRRPESPP